jgi:hypothetical protein
LIFQKHELDVPVDIDSINKCNRFIVYASRTAIDIWYGCFIVSSQVISITKEIDWIAISSMVHRRKEQRIVSDWRIVVSAKVRQATISFINYGSQWANMHIFQWESNSLQRNESVFQVFQVYNEDELNNDVLNLFNSGRCKIRVLSNQDSE